MFSNHVTSLSSSYFHGELRPQESQRVSEHLLVCTRCRAEFDLVKLGAQFAEQLQIVAAPDLIWPAVAKRLDDRKVSFVRFRFLKPLALAASIVIIVVAALVLLRPDRHLPGGQWNVARL